MLNSYERFLLENDKIKPIHLHRILKDRGIFSTLSKKEDMVKLTVDNFDIMYKHEQMYLEDMINANHFDLDDIAEEILYGDKAFTPDDYNCLYRKNKSIDNITKAVKKAKAELPNKSEVHVSVLSMSLAGILKQKR